ncbi:hypothetical protein GTCCBUS3UF5_2310 [Geobacillus thermoleovorans CCB_US3_UF5]|nr:hypothetical protein GTCCBUS3UF5_2310 [Geobacillus thermoleovorans CCB_US3_UF5]
MDLMAGIGCNDDMEGASHFAKRFFADADVLYNGDRFSLVGIYNKWKNKTRRKQNE